MLTSTDYSLQPLLAGYSFRLGLVFHLPSSLVPSSSSRLGIDTLRIGVDLQALFCHGGIAQKVQRHPHQVTLDLIQLLPHLLGRHERIVQVALLELVVAREEGFVVVPRFDCGWETWMLAWDHT